MSNDILEQFRILDSDVLLHYAAFELQDYSPEAQGLLRTVLLERGIDETQIKAYRLLRFPYPTMDFQCSNCGEALTIERQELNEGFYTCPECHSTEAVPYPEISIDDDDTSFTGRKPQVIVASKINAGEEAALGSPSDPMVVLGQGSGVPTLGAAHATENGEVRLLDEGLPETNCAKCGTVLEPESTFMARDNFYCENCYNEIPESERELSSFDSDEE
ncbi:MAG: hypothetical protein WBP29_13205 [Candidatus Zixiibacteriota bacterium]